MEKVKRGLYWFRNDLRLDDNPALNKLNSECNEVIFIYVFDPILFEKTEFGLSRIAEPRFEFIRECLSDLSQQLQSHKQKLIIKVGESNQVIIDLIEEYQINAIGFTPLYGVYEKRQIVEIKSSFKGQLEFYCDESSTLFNQRQLPFEIGNMPDGFSVFRKKIENALKPNDSVKNMVDKPDSFSPVITDVKSDKLPDFTSHKHEVVSMKHEGGEQAAKNQLDYYSFQTKNLSQYKDTRNALDGWDFSSKLSAYLAQGCISPRQIMKKVLDYENQFGSNQSTYWLYFELLWREFYQWHQEKYSVDLYSKKGIQNIDPNLEFDQNLFNKWIIGETENDFVNAFMRQLKLTGWMSNRGRQIVASYFVNQLSLDWRYGAAWFEKQLVDYDPANNWGNWQYLAGVGVDPRGRRAFNIEKQQKTYDPHYQFINFFKKH